MIWVIGGTKDSRDFLEKFASADKNIIVSTATEYGGKLLEGLPVKVISEKLPLETMRVFIEKNSIDIIIDMSHPYAFEVSKNAMRAAEEFSIPYYRFEREEIHIIPDRFSEFENIDDLVKYCDGLEGNILVTLGSNNIERFAEVKELKKFYFRILPKWDMVKKCEDNGILPKNIIAMQGPFSLNMNKAMIEQHGGKNVGSISSKTSFVLAGANMGPAKLEKAGKLGIPILSEEEFLKKIES